VVYPEVALRQVGVIKDAEPLGVKTLKMAELMRVAPVLV